MHIDISVLVYNMTPVFLGSICGLYVQLLGLRSSTYMQVYVVLYSFEYMASS